MAHDVTVVRAKLPFFCNACCRSWAPCAFSGLSKLEVCWPHGPLGVVVPLQSRSRQPKGASPLAVRQCFLASLLRPSCTPRAVKVCLLCTSILRRWRKPFLFKMKQVSMFPCCGCRVLCEKPATPPRASPAIRPCQKI